MGYMAGFNFIMDVHQDDREWANRMIFGIEHSGFYSDKILISERSIESAVTKECGDCEETEYNFSSQRKEMLKYTRGVSLNFGIEMYKGLLLVTGITSYSHYTEINNKVVSNHRNYAFRCWCKVLHQK